jgi:hypothetical protein
MSTHPPFCRVATRAFSRRSTGRRSGRNPNGLPARRRIAALAPSSMRRSSPSTRRSLKEADEARRPLRPHQFPRKTRPLEEPGDQSRIRAACRWCRTGYRLRDARHAGRPRPRLRQARYDQGPDRLVGSRCAGPAAARLRRSDDDDRLERPHLQRQQGRPQIRHRLGQPDPRLELLGHSQGCQGRRRLARLHPLRRRAEGPGRHRENTFPTARCA